MPTIELAPTKTSSNRYAMYGDGGSTSDVIVTIFNGRDTSGYAITEFPSQLAGRAFRCEKIATDVAYDVLIGEASQHDICDCMGFVAHNHCKHVDAIKGMIADGALPEPHYGSDDEFDPREHDEEMEPVARCTEPTMIVTTDQFDPTPTPEDTMDSEKMLTALAAAMDPFKDSEKMLAAMEAAMDPFNPGHPAPAPAPAPAPVEAPGHGPAEMHLSDPVADAIFIALAKDCVDSAARDAGEPVESDYVADLRESSRVFRENRLRHIAEQSKIAARIYRESCG